MKVCFIVLLIIMIVLIVLLLSYLIIYPVQRSFCPRFVKHSSMNALEKYDKKLLVEEVEKFKDDIPRVLVITYKTIDDVPKYKINKWKTLNPDIEIEIYGNGECEKYLNDISPYHKEVFRKIKDGPIKSDYFRTHRMKDGGIYVDIDTTPFNLKPYLTGEIIIPVSRRRNRLNPTLIITPKNHPFILQSIEGYDYIVKNTSYSYWGWSIVTLMSILNMKNEWKLPTVFKEKCGKNLYDCYMYDVKTSKHIFKNRSNDYDSKNHKFLGEKFILFIKNLGSN